MCPLRGKIESERHDKEECVSAECHEASICSVPFYRLSRENEELIRKKEKWETHKAADRIKVTMSLILNFQLRSYREKDEACMIGLL